MINALIYPRISQKEQSNFSLKGQEADLRYYCNKQGWKVGACIIEDGQSAKNFKRTGWKEVERLVKTGKFQYIVVWSYSRFSRNITDALTWIEEFESKYNIRVQSVTEPIDFETADEEIILMQRTLALMMSNVELLTLKKRTTFGMRTGAMEGRYMNAAPYGYINAANGKEKFLKIETDKAAIVGQIFTDYLDGLEFAQILRRARERGFSRMGKSSIRRILENFTYAGLIKVPAHKKEPERLIKGIHEPIVSEVMYWKIQEQLSGRKHKIKQMEHPDFPLRGIVKHECGRALTGSYSKGRNGQYGYYRCHSCKWYSRAEDMHGEMSRVLQSISLKPLLVETLKKLSVAKLREANADRDKRLKVAKDELEQNERDIKSAQLLLIRKQLKPEDYATWEDELRQRSMSLKYEIESLSFSLVEMQEQFNAALPMLMNVSSLYDALPVMKKQGLLRLIFGSDLIKTGAGLRTSGIMPIFEYNAQITNILSINKKADNGEQIDEIGNGSPYGAVSEPFSGFMSVVNLLKIIAA